MVAIKHKLRKLYIYLKLVKLMPCAKVIKSLKDSMLIVTLIVGFCYCSMFCCSLLYVHSSFAIILMRKRELVAKNYFVFLVSCDCCVALPHDATGLSAVCDCGIS